VDGRWCHHFQEFARVHLKAGERTDSRCPRGSGRSRSSTSSEDFNFFRRRIEARRITARGASCDRARTCVVSHAQARSIVVSARQIADLRRAAGAEMFDDVTVETYFARLSGTQPRK
jgi:hypothetical protein